MTLGLLLSRDRSAVGPHALDHHHLGKVLAGEETDEDPVWIGDGQSRSSRSVEPIEHGF